MELFCYGSLEFPAVMRAVTGRSFPHERARLDGWVRLRIRGADYPGIRPRAGASTPGTLWRDLDADSLARLDRFETALYERLVLPVRTASGESLDAQVYAIRSEHRRELSNQPWDRARFARESLAAFVRALTRS
jgi:gamma-glutamylcyclotransferase (GGCT)/AIG2-like uncharacterized protein YtfP